MEMKKLRFLKKCLLVKANAFFVKKYPFAQYSIYRSHYNQIGFNMEENVHKKAIRLDGWIYTSDDNLKKMLDAVKEFAKCNGCSKVYYFDRISDERAKPLTWFGFKKRNGYMADRLFELEVT